MAERPPPNSGDTWSEVMKQVQDALDEAQIDGEALRTSLLDGVRQALDSLDDFLVEPESTFEDEEDHIPVVVVEGGRKDDQPITEGEVPVLHIAEESDDAHSQEALDEPSSGSASDEAGSLSTTVRVFRSGLGLLPQSESKSAISSDTRLRLADEGQIAVGPEGSSSQTLFRGQVARVYRVHCLEGEMRVQVDGQPVELLMSGQSLDVEAQLLCVVSEGEASARGRFTRVAGS